MRNDSSTNATRGKIPAAVRCAIYTRKSTEEGLDQEFNSLHAQREAAEAYIKSQKQLGWRLVSNQYDDGGFTGGNLDRPALQQLLDDIDAHHIDCVVVYKVDRLSRSLLDFARLMDRFDQHSVSFVSVTQQFNTTSSLGRLTLNILLSFAQFEREIISERTRDKMGAARRKGKWVGGVPVLGYDIAAGGGMLVINEDEARQVRAIFTLFLEHRALGPVLDHTHRHRWTTKRWTTRTGRLHEGRPFAKQHLGRLLTNAIYAGKIQYRGNIYLGEHAAVIEEQVWQRAQDLLREHRCDIDRGSHRNLTRSTEKATCPVHGGSEPVPRITRLLALALKFEGLIFQGVVSNYTELARLGRVSRSRITQIMNLLNLAPEIQEEILFLTDEARGKHRVWEASVRTLSCEMIWSQQRLCPGRS